MTNARISLASPCSRSPWRPVAVLEPWARSRGRRPPEAATAPRRPAPPHPIAAPAAAPGPRAGRRCHDRGIERRRRTASARRHGRRRRPRRQRRRRRRRRRGRRAPHATPVRPRADAGPVATRRRAARLGVGHPVQRRRAVGPRDAAPQLAELRLLAHLRVRLPLGGVRLHVRGHRRHALPRCGPRVHRQLDRARPALRPGARADERAASTEAGRPGPTHRTPTATRCRSSRATAGGSSHGCST